MILSGGWSIDIFNTIFRRVCLVYSKPISTLQFAVSRYWTSGYVLTTFPRTRSMFL